MIKFLAWIGLLNGRSLDGILAAFNKLDRELEIYDAEQEARAQKKAEKAEALWSKADAEYEQARAIQNERQRASRVRKKMAALVQ